MKNLSNNHSNESSKLIINPYFQKNGYKRKKGLEIFIQKLIRKLKTSKTTLNFLHLQTGLEEERPAGLSIPA